MILRNYVMLVVVFKCIICATFDDVTERLRQQKRSSEENYENSTTRRQADCQRTSHARSAEGDEQATARRDENRKRSLPGAECEADEYNIKL